MNLDTVDQMVRFWLSAALAVVGLAISGAHQELALAITCLMLLAAFLLLTAATRFCPVFFVLDINHAPDEVSPD